jgi:RNA polymerase-binding transcription factor DksA
MSVRAQEFSAADYEQRLLQRRQVLRDEIRNTLLRADAEQYARIADQVQDADSHSLAEMLAEVSYAEVARDVAEVGDIEVALQRLTAGCYGICTRCGGAIPLARLAVYPTAKRCLPCQQLYEQAADNADIN